MCHYLTLTNYIILVILKGKKMKKILKTIGYLLILLLCTYFAFHWSEYIHKLKWYNWIGKTIEISALFASIGGFYLSYKAIYKVVEIEEAMFQKEINKGYATYYSNWINEYETSKQFHSSLYQELTDTVTHHIKHVGKIKGKKLKNELKILEKKKIKAEKINKNFDIFILHSLKCFLTISNKFSNGD